MNILNLHKERAAFKKLFTSFLDKVVSFTALFRVNARYSVKPMWVFIVMMNPFVSAQGQTIALGLGREVIYKASSLSAGDLQYRTSHSDFVNSDLDSTKITIVAGGIDDKISIKIYFRKNKDDIDSSYLTNARTLHAIDSIMNQRSVEYIDSLCITAFASPEGASEYNQKLSERRAVSFREYLLKKYPKFALSSFPIHGRGENWEEFRRLVETDSNLPRKVEILSILDNPNLTLAQRQARVVSLENGRIYRDYIYPNYYPKLRSGVSLFVVYNLTMPVDVNSEPIVATVVETIENAETKPKPTIYFESQLIGEVTTIERNNDRYIRPFALKTNLLFDVATLFNVELEVPIGQCFSVLGEWTFPFWGGLGNRGGVAPIPVYSEKYTSQMLSAGVELRYWFNRNKKMNDKAQRWGDFNPLCGWFVGPYVGCGLYDFQFGRDGVQGDFYIATGISGGFAHPIGKYFHMEYSVGVGYMQTKYKHYTLMERHKVYERDGKYTWIGPAKAKVSLVWIPRFRVHNNKGGIK